MMEELMNLQTSLPVAMSEKQWVAKLKFKVSAHQEETLMGQSWLSKAPEMANPQMSFAAVPLHVRCCYLSLVSGMVELGMGRFSTACNEIWLSHGNITFYWIFLPMD